MPMEYINDGDVSREAAGAPRTKRDTFGPGDMEVAQLAASTGAITLVDGVPVSNSVWGNINGTNANANGMNGAMQANGLPNNNNVPLVAVTSPDSNDNIPIESPALSMPGGPPVNMRVPGQEERPRMPHRLSRSYINKPVVVTQYDRPLDDTLPHTPTKAANTNVVAGTPEKTEVLVDSSASPVPVRPPGTVRTNSRRLGKGKEGDVDSTPEASSPQLPTVVPIPVPLPNPAPNIPAANQAIVENTTPYGSPDLARKQDPVDLDDYERVRASFFAVPDPTRPETQQAYREVMAQNANSESGASVENHAPGSTGTSAIAATRVPAPSSAANRAAAAGAGLVAGAGLAAAAGHATRDEPAARPAPVTGPGTITGAGAAPPATPTPIPESPMAPVKRRRPASVPMKVYDHDAASAKEHAQHVANLRSNSRDNMNANSRSNSMRSRGEPSLSPPLSMRGQQRLPPIQDGVMVGDVVPFDRQQQLQTTGTGPFTPQRHQLIDHGPITPPYSNAAPNRSQSFGRRPQPVLLEEGHGHATGHPQAAGFFAPDHRSSLIGRSNTAHSRATLGRNGTLSRASNGGTVGRRAGAFGMGAGLSVGTQPEEVLGRRDIHSRAEVSERQLTRDELRRLSTMEKKDAKKLEKLMKEEEHAQGRSVEQSIRDLKGLTRMQKEAIGHERQSQGRLSKWTQREHKARMRFLKEKERYEKVEAELRNAENDFEERRDHAAGLTAQIAERTQDIDDLRAQKAVDDRERRVKKHAMRNPAFA